MHPLELTNLLEGWPLDGRAWAAGLPEWDALLEWLVANRQNEVEWVLLEAQSWRAFATSDERARRLRVLVERAHAFGVRVGVDAPIVLSQQHAFRLLDERGSADFERARIDARVDWLMALGFDFLNTESGDTEMTHPSSTRMLAWMNEVTARVEDRWHRHVRIKVHCSAGQSADGVVDVHTGEPLDFNQLPLHADRRLAVEPHTVQMYALDDKAPTYGNRDFHALAQFIEDAEGTRPVIWYPESAYWVSVDVDVPLFLPVYARARIHDLALLSAERIDGQSLFSSGWEWGYWLNDVVAARAAWRRPPDLESALADPRFGVSLTPALAHEVAALADDEHRLLVNDGAIGSLAGKDAFDDLFTYLGMSGTQAKPRHVTGDLVAVLDAHADTLMALAAGAAARGIDAGSSPARELADAARVTALRAHHALALQDHDVKSAAAFRSQALAVVHERERAYRVPATRVASFVKGPTAYGFGYLATVHDLFYWRRDEETVARGPWVPCHTNIIDPLDVLFGDGAVVDAARAVRAALAGTFLEDGASCLAAAPPPAPTPTPAP